ncbi:hypothetical protein G2W53_032833 [Senna tora]|uniref:DUF4283 domain-containing protein n=1 Tax=Senna tora TaxID=362788 RepID=A0A834SYZ8_9FABA|nr:hypothetical protein G2W53_032833 [Senna tora]
MEEQSKKETVSPASLVLKATSKIREIIERGNMRTKEIVAKSGARKKQGDVVGQDQKGEEGTKKLDRWNEVGGKGKVSFLFPQLKASLAGKTEGSSETSIQFGSLSPSLVNLSPPSPRGDSKSNRVLLNLSESEKTSIGEPWKNFIIIRLWGLILEPQHMKLAITRLWKLKRDPSLIELNHGFFLVSFELLEDRWSALLHGASFIQGHFLSVRPWCPGFKPEKFLSSFITPAWVRLEGLPMEYYHPNILIKIGNLVGKFLGIDDRTHNLISVMESNDEWVLVKNRKEGSKGRRRWPTGSQRQFQGRNNFPAVSLNSNLNRLNPRTIEQKMRLDKRDNCSLVGLKINSKEGNGLKRSLGPSPLKPHPDTQCSKPAKEIMTESGVVKEKCKQMRQKNPISLMINEEQGLEVSYQNTPLPSPGKLAEADSSDDGKSKIDHAKRSEKNIACTAEPIPNNKISRGPERDLSPFDSYICIFTESEYLLNNESYQAKRSYLKGSIKLRLDLKSIEMSIKGFSPSSSCLYLRQPIALKGCKLIQDLCSSPSPSSLSLCEISENGESIIPSIAKPKMSTQGEGGRTPERDCI